MTISTIVERSRLWLAVETKSSQTVAEDFFVGLARFTAVMAGVRQERGVESTVVYGGAVNQRRREASVVSWSALDERQWWEEDELR